MESIPLSSVYTKNGKLELNTRGGVTVWLTKILTGNIQLEYTRKFSIDGCENDRLSDLNQFWMAQDPTNLNLFTRHGKFETYDSLLLYYVGLGGNTNTTTRFRKYNGHGERVLLQEYTDATHLLKATHNYHIKIMVRNATLNFFVDGHLYFTYTDPLILREGYFGFRSTYSHQVIDHLKIYQLD